MPREESMSKMELFPCMSDVLDEPLHPEIRLSTTLLVVQTGGSVPELTSAAGTPGPAPAAQKADALPKHEPDCGKTDSLLVVDLAKHYDNEADPR